jgi:hypothetical protein
MTTEAVAFTAMRRIVRVLPIEQFVESPFNPRKTFHPRR